MRGLQVRQFAAVALVLFAVACGGDGSDTDSNPVGPGGDNTSADTPGITNNPDDFRFVVTNVTNFSTNGGYTWRNTGTMARVTQSSSISAGSGTLVVRDAGGRIVYQAPLGNSGSVNTEAGPTGDWRIEVAPSNVTGTINFRVERAN